MITKNKTVTPIGNGYYINIPSQYVKDGVIDLKKSYSVELKEEQPNEEKE